MAESVVTVVKLNVPFAEKEKVKQAGARWFPRNKFWYVTKAAYDPAKFPYPSEEVDVPLDALGSYGNSAATGGFSAGSYGTTNTSLFGGSSGNGGTTAAAAATAPDTSQSFFAPRKRPNTSWPEDGSTSAAAPFAAAAGLAAAAAVGTLPASTDDALVRIMGGARLVLDSAHGVPTGIVVTNGTLRGFVVRLEDEARSIVAARVTEVKAMFPAGLLLDRTFDAGAPALVEVLALVTNSEFNTRSRIALPLADGAQYWLHRTADVATHHRSMCADETCVHDASLSSAHFSIGSKLHTLTVEPVVYFDTDAKRLTVHLTMLHAQAFGGASSD